MVDLNRQPRIVCTPSFEPEKSHPDEKIIIVIVKVPDRLPAVLNVSVGEMEKAAKFIKDEDRQAYLYRHHLLRTWLSQWSQKPVSALLFETNPFGKPFLPATKIQFNVSRSKDLLVFIFAPVEVGIDIEMLRDPAPFQPVAKRFFHPDEQEMIKNKMGFFDIWTRKEAALKALGTGLIEGLTSVDCSKNTVVLHGNEYALLTWRTATAVISAAFENQALPFEIFTEENPF